MLGEIGAHPAGLNAKTSEANYRESMAELGMRPLVAHCHFGQARPAHGLAISSNEPFGAATAMYRDMGMTCWLEKAEAASG
jgi:hypothetical protein